ncbi:uncharacterized protein LOC135164114 isoform X2 [Diachasmimorpha longicaudata]|uniref:uncharacterized protein LOC135164114 isoform X2 n=1 Tax=Diachasmimorpha longicaudata TaxID=58733 RepID=UPI0030B8B788
MQLHLVKQNNSIVIMPQNRDIELTYRMKYYTVENEKLFGDIIVTHQTVDGISLSQNIRCTAVYKRRRRNLTQETLDTPDFMALNRKAEKNYQRSRAVDNTANCQGIEYDEKICHGNKETDDVRKPRIYPLPMLRELSPEGAISSLVDQLLLDIYGCPRANRSRSESESTVSSFRPTPQHRYLQKARLRRKSTEELTIVLETLRSHVNHAGGLLIRQLRRRDYLHTKRDRQYDVITAHLQAHSNKRSEDTRMRFSLTPQPGESGFTQWLDAMKMVARLPEGIPPEFRKRLWLTLAERHLEQRAVDWKQAEKLCFNEWSNPDDEELGIQIVKDLHRTGCSLFCGAAGRDNQAVLRRVLLGFARWNKSVGYCQGLNVLAALVLQVTDRAESSAVKVMIYLIEGVLPEGYFADNLRGLSIDMAVFRDLLRMRLPKLSKHLETLQCDAKDKATGSSYEPPLTNVFTMQWFLTLFCHCLPQDVVLRVWDLIFLEGDEVLLRTALAIWEGISDRIMTVTSADEFYSIMGVLTREMLEFTDTNNLIKTIVSMGPLAGVTDLREKHRYNITPWARRLSDDEDTDTEEEEKLAVAAAMYGVHHRLKKGSSIAAGTLQAINQGADKDRLALDISTLKHQYAKLRERQRQAHIILSAACARQSMVTPATSQAMNHLLVGKSALVSAKTRQLGPPPGAIPPKSRFTSLRSPRNQIRKDKQGVTLHWKDTKKLRETKNEPAVTDDVDTELVQSPESMSVSLRSLRRSSADSDSDSTSTELCDDPDRLSDSEEPTSTSDCYIMATDDEKSPRPGSSPTRNIPEIIRGGLDDPSRSVDPVDIETTASIAKITDQIRRLSAGDDNNSIALPVSTSFDRRESKVDVDNGGYDKEIETKDVTSVPVDSDNFIPSNERQLERVVKLHEKYSILGDDVRMSMETTPGAPMADTPVDDQFRVDLDMKFLTQSLDVSEGIETKSLGKISTPEDIPPDTNYFPRGYVIGHLPISPLTVDQKLTKLGVMTPISKISAIEEPKFPAVIQSRVAHLSLDYSQSLKPYEDVKRSPKTPDSAKSFSSGETMGPDSKVSSLTTSPRTPVRADSCQLRSDKSHSSASSDDKTLTMRSIDTDIGPSRSKVQSRCSSDNGSPSTTISVDSLKKSEISPTKIVVSSSSESYCPGAIKSTELSSFSSELHSSTSANSIKYTSTYKDSETLSETPGDLHITSPFYPISSPDQKATSPRNPAKIQNATLLNYKLEESSRFSKPSDTKIPKKIDDYDSGRSFEAELALTLSLSSKSERTPSTIIGVHQRDSTNDSKLDKYEATLNKEALVEHFLEDDTVSPLPRDKYMNLQLSEDHLEDLPSQKRTPTKFERSYSVLEKKFTELKLSTSTEDFIGTKKRSSDILDDLRHMEATALESSVTNDTNMTRKTGYDWEDLKSLEARRQDTFSDSASGFSQARLDLPGITISNEGRKTYVVEPRIQMDEASDSILKNYTKRKENGEPDDDKESKLGVWTKVKPRKIGENGRRSSSDRALKIIQENSAILHKILTCQAKKRLPDLEEISKEITISPINEEISKIFSPILEKMGLNEQEINEELARINFKDFDQMKTTNGSEFDAKMHDELSKLSIIDDNEEINHLDVDEMISGDYLNTREALIDKQINEELSKLLANYDKVSPISLDPYDKGSSSQNDIEGMDLTSISTNVFSYNSSNDSIETKSDLGPIQDSSAVEKFHHYTDITKTYQPSTKYDLQSIEGLSPKSDLDIYRELEKLNKISSVHVLPTPNISQQIVSPGAYGSDLPSYEPQLPSVDYMKPEKPFEDSLKSPYDTYKPYAFTASKVSPLKPSNPFPRTYDKSMHDEGLGILSDIDRPSMRNYEIGKRQLLSKETLEFRVRYDEDNVPSEEMREELSYRGYPGDLDRGVSYYDDESVSINRSNKEERRLPLTSPTDYLFEKAEYRAKYLAKAREDYFLQSDYERTSYKRTPPNGDRDIGAYIPMTHRRDVSPNYQFEERSYGKTVTYNSKLSCLDPVEGKTGEMSDDPGRMQFEVPSRELIAYRKASMTLGPLENVTRVSSGYDTGASPKGQFNPFPVRNTTRKPKELGLKLGLYSPSSPGASQGKRS